MNKSINLFTSFFIVMLILLFLFVTQAKAQQWCNLCAMNLKTYRLTKYILTLENKTQKHTCSIHCAAIVINNNNVIRIEVSDYETGNMINTEDSYYVVKSDIKGVMSKTSKLAFANRSKAEQFIAHHGGTLADFDRALKIANQDMEQDVHMLKDKIFNLVRLGQNVAEAKSCFACHGSGAAGAPVTGDAEAWGERMEKGIDVVLANAMNGTGAMPAKGMCMDCTEENIRSLIDFMVEGSQ